jgi:hypothetical protein
MPLFCLICADLRLSVAKCVCVGFSVHNYFARQVNNLQPVPKVRLLLSSRMSSLAQQEANRLNAQKSTGPRSVEGKAVTRFNSLKHGVDAQSLVIPGEDPAQLLQLADDYQSTFNPANPVENFLLDTMIHSDWNKRRYTRVQSQLLRLILPNGPADTVDFALAETFLENTPETRALNRVARRIAAEHRNFMRALAELRRLQKQRLAQENQQDPADDPAGDAPAAPENWVRSAPGPQTPANRPEKIPAGANLALRL